MEEEGLREILLFAIEDAAQKAYMTADFEAYGKGYPNL